MRQQQRSSGRLLAAIYVCKDNNYHVHTYRRSLPSRLEQIIYSVCSMSSRPFAWPRHNVAAAVSTHNKQVQIVESFSRAAAGLVCVLFSRARKRRGFSLLSGAVRAPVRAEIKRPPQAPGRADHHFQREVLRFTGRLLQEEEEREGARFYLLHWLAASFFFCSGAVFLVFSLPPPAACLLLALSMCLLFLHTPKHKSTNTKNKKQASDRIRAYAGWYVCRGTY